MKKNGVRALAAASLIGAVLLSASGCSTLAAAGLQRAAASPTPQATAVPLHTPTPVPLYTPEPESTEKPTVEALPTAAPNDSPEVPATPEPGTVQITEENYQMLFAPAPGYDHIGVAYMKAPAAYSTFADAYLPYGGSIVYRDGGYTVLGSAHGISVLERVFDAGPSATAETSMESLTAYYEALLAESGESLGSLGETDYYAEYDIAVQQARSLSGDGQYTHDAILYSDTRGNGYYFQAILLYFPEQFDEETPALLEELSDVFGMTLPQA